MKSVDHIFFTSPHAQFIWKELLRKLGYCKVTGSMRMNSIGAVKSSECPCLIISSLSICTAFDEHVRRSKSGGIKSREMDFESFLDFVLALENKDTPEGLTYLFRCLDLNGRGYLTTADIHTLFRDVHQKWIEGGNYDLCIEDVRDEIWDMVKPTDPLRITLADLLACKQGGTVASMLIDVRGFWAHDNRENLLQEEEEPEEE
ncbi:hypothetical protein GIB67_010639 [Kingdonia uniflora]|uniref:EF-hand domain-containing protein n=1 Tax=Kingdonia uniflora TaxID=39325 RepID=A0A7J7NR32_9MAGN|nr:hypothetical protein GIB67_010639 [Kingdonia uniflora]